MTENCPYWGKYHFWVLAWTSPRGAVYHCTCGATRSE